MLGINASGRPDKRNYLLGRACIFLSKLDSAGAPTHYRPVGNAPDLTVSVDVEELTHRASLCKAFGGAVIDARIITEQSLNVTMTLEEIDHDNVGVFFQATVDSVANPEVAGVAEYALTTSAALNCWYPIMDPATGIRIFDLALASLTVEDGTTPLTQGVKGTGDYELDSKSGMIIIYGDGPNTVSAGATINVTVAPRVGATATVERVLALKAPQQRYAIKALVENANNLDEMVEMEFHSVLLSGDGDFAPIGDELAQMTLSGVAEANQALVGTPTLTIQKLTAA